MIFFFGRIAVYKALYRLFGGFVADVVAAIDQVFHKQSRMKGIWGLG